MKNINQEELSKVLKEHELWLKGKGGKRADLENTNLKDVYLKNANLQYANLKDANLELVNLRGSNLRYANLRNANLQYTNLAEVNLEDANLSYANLEDANLRCANLKNSDLRYANLSYANLKGSYLEGVKTNINTIGYNLACPEKGSFIGYKKAKIENNYCIVNLLITEDSKRSSATTRKCRCSKAKVLSITSLDNTEEYKECFSKHDKNFKYKVEVSTTSFAGRDLNFIEKYAHKLMYAVGCAREIERMLNNKEL